MGENKIVEKLPQVVVDTSDATLSDSVQLVSGVTAYSKGQEITGTMPTKSAETFTPGTADITISSGQYIAGDQVIEGDANLIAENIKKDVTIFEVTGTLESGGGGGLELLDRASVDGSAYAESGDLNELPPVLCVFDKDHKDGTAFTTNPTIVQLAAFGVPDGDIPMLLSARVFAKNKLPDVYVYSDIGYRNNSAIMYIQFYLGGHIYLVNCTVALTIDPESEALQFTATDFSYECDYETITDTEFYEAVERIVIYLSVSDSEFILPINTTFTFPMLIDILPPEVNPEMIYQEEIYSASSYYPNTKIFDIASDFIYTVFSIDHGEAVYGISVGPNGFVKRLSFEEWIDPDGNSRYLKFDNISSPRIIYKWSEIKDNLENIALEMENAYYEQYTPISLFVDEQIEGHTDFPLGEYQFISTGGVPAFTLQDMRSFSDGYLTYWDIAFIEEDPYVEFMNHWIATYTPE